jgi:hypothetical protein
VNSSDAQDQEIVIFDGDESLILHDDGLALLDIPAVDLQNLGHCEFSSPLLLANKSPSSKGNSLYSGGTKLPVLIGVPVACWHANERSRD